MQSSTPVEHWEQTGSQEPEKKGAGIKLPRPKSPGCCREGRGPSSPAWSGVWVSQDQALQSLGMPPVPSRMAGTTGGDWKSRRGHGEKGECVAKQQKHNKTKQEAGRHQGSHSPIGG